MSAAARLLEDGGAAAAGPEFFRSAEFLAAEGATHTLVIAAAEGELAAPLLVREIPGGGADAISPYGYPGAVAPPGAAVDPAEVDWSPTGLVSLFLRHRLGGEPPLRGTTARNQVQIADPALAAKSRPSDRRQIRRNEEDGYRVRRVLGAEATDADRRGFLSAYEETMRRAGADDRYFFSEQYFDRLLCFEDSHLFLATERQGEVAAASIVARSDAMLHYYLSGTLDRFVPDSPMKNLVASIAGYAAEREMPLNLGGGMRPGDALEEFKRGFANRSEPFHTSEIVADPAAYERLSEGRDATGFFPAYRA